MRARSRDGTRCTLDGLTVGAIERMLRTAPLLALIALAGARDAAGLDYSVHGYIDLRFVAPSSQRSFTDGGLGKTRYGDGDGGLHLGSAALVINARPSPAWMLVADLQAHDSDRTRIELVEAFARYRPVSTSPWRWSAKAGEYFPPVSFENDAIGWTSRYTITPSAINSWIGEELRVVGSEVRVERRGDPDTVEAAFGLYGANDPAGDVLAARGWSFSDRTYGYGDATREPDVYAHAIEHPVPLRSDSFHEIDHRVGWYGELVWRSDRFGKVSILRYDNNGDPAAYRRLGDGTSQFAWDTYFWSVAAQTRIGDVVVIAQGMRGDTIIEPAPAFVIETEFDAAFVLAAWDRGAWQPAIRFDRFDTRETTGFDDATREHGHAWTVALNWRPRNWLRITAEALRVDSTRNQRTLKGVSPHAVENQVQLVTRLTW